MSDGEDTLVGTTLSESYVIERILGEGGMGRVYLASHTRIPGKRFAIKALHEEFARHDEALARFKREAEAGALVNHPQVVAVQDMGTAPDGRPFIVTEFLDGEELHDRIERSGALTPTEAVPIFLQVCSALAAAHAQGVIHRDVKPENIFLVGGGPDLVNAKLLDFGISRLADSGRQALTAAGIALGTPAFMSPEQARGKPVDHRVDIYSVGLSLYVALTGVSPFERDAPNESLMALLTEEVPPPSMLEPGIPPDLEKVVLRAMAREPDERFARVEELHAALAPFATAPSPTAVAPAPPSASATATTSAPAPTPRPTPRTAPTVLAVNRRAPSSPAPGSLVVAATLCALGALAAAATLIGGLARAGGVRLETGGWAVIIVAVVLVLATPVGLFVRHAQSEVLPAPERIGPATRALQGPLLAGASAYGLIAAWARLISFATRRRPDLGAPAWDVWLVLVAAGAAGVALWSARREQPPPAWLVAAGAFTALVGTIAIAVAR